MAFEPREAGSVLEEIERGAQGDGIVLHKREYMGVFASECNNHPTLPRWWYDAKACSAIARRLKGVRG